MKDGVIQLCVRDPLFREAVSSFFEALHGVVPCRTFILATYDQGEYTVLCASNAEEPWAAEGAVITFPLAAHGEDFRSICIPVLLQDGRLFGQICALDREHRFRHEDVQWLKRTAAVIGKLIEAEENVYYDKLTGLHRRKSAEAIYYNLPMETPKAAVFVDLDDFARINKWYGQETGDEVLRMTGAILKDTARRFDSLAFRYDGDQFVLIVPDGRQERVLEAVHELMARFSNPMRIGNLSLTVTASIGICLQADSLQHYIERADAAKNQIKRGAKRGFQIYTG